MRASKLLVTTALFAEAVVLSRPAAALNPLEYPDNGSTAFARGGAWLATATDPIAAHYNPAALATQKSAVSIEGNASFQKICFDRRNPGNELTGPNQGTNTDPGTTIYLPACNARTGFPKAIPAINFTWRVSSKVGIGFGLVAPSAYTDAIGAWPELTDGYSRRTGQRVKVPAPYRYLTTENQSLVFLPTVGIGVEVLPRLRVGAGFVWGIAQVDFSKIDSLTASDADRGDRSADDVRARLRTHDYFMPGAVLSAHWSATRTLDFSIWGRWMDAIRTTNVDLQLLAKYYSGSKTNPNTVETRITDKDFKYFKFQVITPELRAGIRFHLPRQSGVGRGIELGAGGPEGYLVRDPLHDDVFDVEFDGSFTQNSKGDTTEVRFPQGPDGSAVVDFNPGGRIPPNADRVLGYKDTWGGRLGGQVNVVRDKFALLLGGWYETRAADDAYLNTSPVPAARGGFGGGIMLRQAPLDFVIGYQRHWSQEMDNNGDGATRANAGVHTSGDPFLIGAQPADRQFRTTQFINGGRLTQSADVFTMGAVMRFW